MKQYIIAVIGGVRKDLAPKYTGEFGKVYEYGSFDLIVWTGGSWGDEYEKAYKMIEEHVTKCNDDLKGSRYHNGWIWAEMLTPNTCHEYNDTYCHHFHTWLATEMLKADEIIVSKTNINGRDLYDRIKVWDNMETVAKMARTISEEMLREVHLPGEYLHKMYVESENTIFLKDYPIFELGWTLPYSIQIIDRGLNTKLWLKSQEK